MQAASLPETYFTVWSNVFDRGALKPGKTFLVQGGSSGIGVAAIQMVRALGNRASRSSKAWKNARRASSSAPSAQSTTGPRTSSKAVQGAHRRQGRRRGARHGGGRLRAARDEGARGRRAHRDHRHPRRIESRRGPVGSAASAATLTGSNALAAIRGVQGRNRPRVARKVVATRQGRKDESDHLRDVSVGARGESPRADEERRVHRQDRPHRVNECWRGGREKKGGGGFAS